MSTAAAVSAAAVPTAKAAAAMEPAKATAAMEPANASTIAAPADHPSPSHRRPPARHNSKANRSNTGTRNHKKPDNPNQRL